MQYCTKKVVSKGSAQILCCALKNSKLLFHNKSGICVRHWCLLRTRAHYLRTTLHHNGSEQSQLWIRALTPFKLLYTLSSGKQGLRNFLFFCEEIYFFTTDFHAKR